MRITVKYWEYLYSGLHFPHLKYSVNILSLKISRTVSLAPVSGVKAFSLLRILKNGGLRNDYSQKSLSDTCLTLPRLLISANICNDNLNIHTNFHKITITPKLSTFPANNFHRKCQTVIPFME